MFKLVLFFIALTFNSVSAKAQISAKRKAPKEVAPVTIDNIRYTAPASQMGYVVARDAKTDTVLWKKQIYKVKYKKDLETDVQDVFIDSLYVKGNKLKIHTENGRVYTLQ